MGSEMCIRDSTPRVVIGENKNFVGSEKLLRKNGVELVLAENEQIENTLRKFIKENPSLWFEDIGKLDE